MCSSLSRSLSHHPSTVLPVLLTCFLIHVQAVVLQLSRNQLQHFITGQLHPFILAQQHSTLFRNLFILEGNEIRERSRHSSFQGQKLKRGHIVHSSFNSLHVNIPHTFGNFTKPINSCCKGVNEAIQSSRRPAD